MRTLHLASTSLALWTAACSITPPLEVTESGGSGSEATTGTTDAATGTEGATGNSDAATESTGGTTESTGGQATDTGDVPAPAACGEIDPKASAQFELALAGWPGDNTTEDHDIDVACTVDAVTLDTTALTCDVDGAPLPATLTLASGGEVAWAKGDSVRLRAKSFSDSELGLGMFRSLSLRTADDSLLAVGVEDEFLHEELFAPLSLQVQLACGPEDIDAEPISFGLDFSSEGGGDSLSLISGHRGVLLIEADFGYAIDLAEATTNNCCHYTRWHHVLLRKVRTPIND